MFSLDLAGTSREQAGGGPSSVEQWWWPSDRNNRSTLPLMARVHLMHICLLYAFSSWARLKKATVCSIYEVARVGLDIGWGFPPPYLRLEWGEFLSVRNAEIWLRKEFGGANDMRPVCRKKQHKNGKTDLCEVLYHFKQQKISSDQKPVVFVVRQRVLKSHLFFCEVHIHHPRCV